MAIHEQDYVRYDGPIIEGRAWAVIAWNSFRTMLAFLRTKLVLIFLWLGPLIFIGLSLLEYGVNSSGLAGGSAAPPGWHISLFLQVQVYSVVIILLASGCGIISDDLRHRTFQLYFSKPVGRYDYAIGKFLGLYMLAGLAGLLPALVVAGVRGAFYTQTEFFKEVATQLAMGVGLSAVYSAVLCAIVIGLSSLTRSAGTVVLSLLGAVIVPQIFSLIVAIATGGSEAGLSWFTGTAQPAHLWSLTGNMLVVSQWAIAGEPIEQYAWAAPVILAVITAAGLGALVWRVSKLEGVA